jgi:CheY-like chemotaxis protein
LRYGQYHPSVPPARSSASIPKCSVTILIVEHSPRDRNLARLILAGTSYAGASYKVLEVSDPARAVATYLDNAESIDLILISLVLTQLGRVEAAGKISNRYPDVNIILSRSYPESNQHTKSVIDIGRPPIQKPLGVDVLGSKFRTALDKIGDERAETS